MASSSTLEDLISKYNLVKNHKQNDIIFIKLQNDEHYWPAKISSCFIQKKKQNIPLPQQNDDYYDPYSKSISKKSKKNKNSQTMEIIYKVRYFQWQCYAYVTNDQIKPYSQSFYDQLSKLKDKKLHKALEKASNQMVNQQKQRIKIENQNKLTNKKQKNFLKNCLNLKDDISLSYTTQSQINDRQIKIQKKQMKRIKIIKKQEEKIPQKQKILIGVNNLAGGKIANQKYKKQASHYQQAQVKQQFQDTQTISPQSAQTTQHMKKTHPNQTSQVKQQYKLNNVLYKNKYQILGTFSDILQDFTSLLLWFDTQNNDREKVQKVTSTLIKILDALEIFKFQQLTQSKSLQKMLNIIKVAELVRIRQIRSNLNTNRNHVVHQIYNTYVKIVMELNRMKVQMKIQADHLITFQPIKNSLYQPIHNNLHQSVSNNFNQPIQNTFNQPIQNTFNQSKNSFGQRLHGIQEKQEKKVEFIKDFLKIDRDSILNYSVML